MFNKKTISQFACPLLMLLSANVFAHHEQVVSGYEQFMHFVVLGCVSAAMLGAIYFMLVMIGKLNVKKGKGVTE